MRSIRETIGGVGNLMFKDAFMWMLFREGVIPDIYVQSEKYWAKYKNEIKQRYGQGIGRIDKVAVHIRRGDYLKVPEFHLDLWPTGYYQKAFKMFPDSEFLIFCKDNQNPLQDKDDREWCKENLIPILGENFEMYNHTTETDDLNAMASCEGLIAANSTFSWWAAYLGNHDKVIFPEQWFGDGVERCEMLPEWIKI